MDIRKGVSDMRVVLLAAAGLIAAAAVGTSAAAQSGAAAGFSGSSGITVRHGGQFNGSSDGFRHDRRRHSRRGDDDGVFILDREYQGDTAWRANSYNDWWHERPHRSHPAWMSRNQNCERVYWSGGGWTC
jgi:hypothetical protein